MSSPRVITAGSMLVCLAISIMFIFGLNPITFTIFVVFCAITVAFTMFA
jgi:hypothetical protein